LACLARCGDREIVIQYPGGARGLPFSKRLGWHWGPLKSFVRWIPGAVFSAVEQPGREADRTPANRLKNESSNKSLHRPIRLHGLHRKNFLVPVRLLNYKYRFYVFQYPGTYFLLHASSMCVHRFHFLCFGFCDDRFCDQIFAYDKFTSPS
jgi:hypothetical protein